MSDPGDYDIDVENTDPGDTDPDGIGRVTEHQAGDDR